jgi:hypothetical protein
MSTIYAMQFIIQKIKTMLIAEIHESVLCYLSVGGIIGVYINQHHCTFSISIKGHL